MADVRCQECKEQPESLFDALSSIVWYDGHYVWLKDLRDELVALPDGKWYPMPDDIQWHSEKHTIMMLLVGMFGDWGTSIRGGWITDKSGCIQFIEQLCKESWEVRGEGDG